MYLRGKRVNSTIHNFMSPLTDKYVAGQLVQQMTIIVTLSIGFIASHATDLP